MASSLRKSLPDDFSIGRYALAGALLWTLVVGGLLAWNLYQNQAKRIEIATSEAMATIKKDLAFRRWAASHGGIYVVPDENTPPNPYLEVPDRDVTTLNGKPLTLMNPAYMMRQMQQQFSELYGAKSRITSLNPLNPINAPDAWEREALQSFEQGATEKVELTQIDGKKYIRALRALRVEKECLKCHRKQGYRIGDVRGGLEASVPVVEDHRAIAVLSASHGGIWLIGLGMIGFVYRRGQRNLRERASSEQVITARNQELQTLYRVSEICLRADSADAAFQEVVDEVRQAAGFPMVAIELYDEARQKMIFKATAGLTLERDFEVDATQTLSGVVARSGQVLVETNARDRPETVNQSLRALNAKSFVCVPMLIGDKVVGVLSLASPEAMPVEERQVQWLASLANSVVSMLERRRSEQHLRLITQVFENSDEGIVVADKDVRIVFVNHAFTDITGYAAEEVLGQNPRVLSSGRHGKEFFAEMWNILHTSGHWQGEIWNRRKNGKVYPEWLTITTAHNDADEVSHYIANFSDISERKAADERILYLANYDALTGLPNRTLLRDRMEHEITVAHRRHKQAGVLCLDLDNFKTINDSLGHSTGDLLLQAVAERLKECVREGDTLARLGGDDFVVVLSDFHQAGDTVQVAQKILDALSRPYNIVGHELIVTSSIGISIYPDDGKDAESLLKNADAAMYHAKQSGRNNYKFFTHDMNARVLQRLSLEGSLRRALEREEFVLHYQPQVEIGSGRIVGLEALIRWQHPDMGMVSPAQFIPVAEESGLIVPIGEWVLNEACRQNRAWQDEGLPAVPVAVNISARQLWQKGLARVIEQALRDSGLPARYLELEMTESAIMHDMEQLIEMLREFSAMGLQLSIDDFGTGYSSLNYVKRFPLDKLKIDQSFVRDLTTDPDDAAITSAIISMARSLNLKVIAEGVETVEQLRFLAAHQCDEIQGYYFSRPLPAPEAARLLREGKRLER